MCVCVLLCTYPNKFKMAFLTSAKHFDTRLLFLSLPLTRMSWRPQSVPHLHHPISTSSTTQTLSLLWLWINDTAKSAQKPDTLLLLRICIIISYPKPNTHTNTHVTECVCSARGFLTLYLAWSITAKPRVIINTDFPFPDIAPNLRSQHPKLAHSPTKLKKNSRRGVQTSDHRRDRSERARDTSETVFWRTEIRRNRRRQRLRTTSNGIPSATKLVAAGFGFVPVFSWELSRAVREPRERARNGERDCSRVGAGSWKEWVIKTEGKQNNTKIWQ